jgi:hypothetical protein
LEELEMEQMENFLAKNYEKLSATGDPLERLNAVMNWKIFEPLIEKAFKRERKSPAGRRPYNRLWSNICKRQVM